MPTRALGRLVPVRTSVEVAGFVLAVLLAAAGLMIVAPWRVSLAPVRHPEI